MREVAEKVGYSPTTLYLYFKDKRDILREIILRGFAQLADFADMSMVGPSGLDKFRQRCRAYVVWGIMHPGLYDLMLQWRMSDLGWTDVEAAKVTEGFAPMVSALAEALEAGQLRGMADPAAFAIMAWAGLHGVTSLSVSRRFTPGTGEVTPEATLKMATEMGDALVEGLLGQYLTK